MATLVGINYKDKEKRSIACQELFLKEDLFPNKDPERQISFISEVTERRLMEDPNKGFCHLKFKGNLVIEGLDLFKIKRDQRINIGEATLQVTMIGKECHDNCPLSNLETCDINQSIFFGRLIRPEKVEVGYYVEFEK